MQKTAKELLKLYTQYYPLGLNHISNSFSNSGFESFYSYKYNDKELQETGLFKKIILEINQDL
ncbi:hypothetical protein [Chryseobacterium culicis]|uniref:hypothetical protein n=1 Tax=Chryseobacterium culicis TaxID=680127 RepID=UPI00187647BB|nr:hypothetical protein [Chryseobacterium culicis]MBE4949352.1 hypothetical protein [Chryseobacterium culicis]